MFERRFYGSNGKEVLKISPITLKVELVSPNGKFSKYIGARELKERYGIDLDYNPHVAYLNDLVEELEYRIQDIEEKIRYLLCYLYPGKKEVY